MAPLSDPASLAAITLVLLLGATVKGALGVGMPLVSIPLLSLLVTPPVAIGLLAAPILVSNAMQLREARGHGLVVRRIAWLMAFQYFSLFLTVRWTSTISVVELNQWMALSVLLASCMLIFKPKFKIDPAYEPPLNVLVGLMAGFMGGVSALTGPVVIAYLVALRMGREEFIGTISAVYLLSAAPMYVLMLIYGRFGWNEILLSVLALVPMFFGLAVGRRLRQYLNENAFRYLLLIFLLATSVSLYLKK